jgi:hypothetical protein
MGHKGRKGKRGKGISHQSEWEVKGKKERGILQARREGKGILGRGYHIW